MKAWIADCWKVFWNDEPAALIVPLAVAPGEVPPAGLDAGEDAGVDELGDEHAATASAAATAPPVMATRNLPRNCMWLFSLRSRTCPLGRPSPGRPYDSLLVISKAPIES